MGQGQQVIHLHDLLVHFKKILYLWLQLFIRICKVDYRFIKFLQANFYKQNRIFCRLIWFQWAYNMAMMHFHIVNWVGSFVDVVELSIGVISWIVPTIFNSYVTTNRSSHLDPWLLFNPWLGQNLQKVGGVYDPTSRCLSFSDTNPKNTRNQ
jgi:hypothetical protein